MPAGVEEGAEGDQVATTAGGIAAVAPQPAGVEENDPIATTAGGIAAVAPQPQLQHHPNADPTSTTTNVAEPLESSSNVLFGAVVEDIETVVIGSRLGIWWDDDQKYRPCTVLEQEKEEEMHELFVQYDDDGTHECLNVKYEKVCWIKEEDDQNCEDRASASENSDSNKMPPKKK